jgi:Tfp pilus assembly protein PilN
VRPVNLIPEDERRGGSAPGRVGPLSYFIVGGLALVLVGVCAVVLLGNSVEDKQAEIEELEAQAIETEARAESLAPYVSFQEMRDSRSATIDSLAKSRFDWERVISELARVIPEDISLSNLTGTVSPEVQVEDAAAVPLRTEVPGPALELVGCARSQPGIAGLVAALHDIDGVTRVTAANGIKSTTSDSEESASDDTQADTDGGCQRSQPAFQIVVAFDAVPTAGADLPPADSGSAPTSEQQAVAGADAEVTEATNLVPGG